VHENTKKETIKVLTPNANEVTELQIQEMEE
jgi:hypothetical protein